MDVINGMPRLHQRRAEARGRRQGQGSDLALRQLPQKRLKRAVENGEIHAVEIHVGYPLVN